MKECIRNAVALTRPEEIDSETVISKMAEATTLTKGSEVPQNGTVPTETPTTPAVIKGTDVQHSETITTETPTTSAVTKGSEVPQNRTVKTETPTTAATVNSVNVSLLCSCMVLFLFNVYFSSSTFAYS